jgi:hypothetical protein
MRSTTLRNPIRIGCVIARIAFACALLIVMAGAATAYTLVFRDGHRIEAPSVFTLTSTTLTYEAAPGINRTVQLILIDVATTERVNNEPPGSFLKHDALPLPTVATSPARHAVRTLTNRDLEAVRQRRIDSETNYEQRRIELGLPSVEETRRQQAAEDESILALARERAAAEANDEAYWRGRAADLRGEIAAVDAQINYLRTRLGPLRPFPLATQGFLIGGGSFRQSFGGGFTVQPGAGRMGSVIAPPAGTRNLMNMGARALRPSRSSDGFGRAPSRQGVPILPFGYVDNSFAGTDLEISLNNLLVRRAGLEALWRDLENEARVAKVPQVWLAPY